MAKILLIGSLTKDLIRIQNISKNLVGGSVYYAAEALNKFGDDVTLIPLLSLDNKSLLRHIHKRINVKPIYIKETFLFENIYSSKNIFNRKQRVLTLAGINKGITIQDLKDLNLKEYDLIYLGPQSNIDISKEVISYIFNKNKKVCLYAQGFFRNFYETEIKEQKWEEANKYLNHIYTLILSDKQLLALSKKNNIKKAILKIAQMGPKEIIVNMGKNGFLIYKDNHISPAPYPNLKGFINPNGVTSTFSAIYLSERTKNKNVENAIEYAINAAYIKMNSWQPLKKDRNRIEKIIKVHDLLNKLN
jgi:sugar/nucleoside kinase (ribokinase family)